MSVSTNGAGPRTSGASPLPELEGEWEALHEDEGEEFLSGLAGLAGRAARSALGALTSGDQESEFEYLFEAEGEFEDESLHEEETEFEDEGEYEGESLHEYEDEAEFEEEAMANPLRRVYPDAMMEHLGHAAAEAESEEEAEALIGAVAPLAIGLARRAAPAVLRAAPHLVRGLAGVTRTLRRDPATRPLVQALPTIAVRTARSLARQVARGRPVTARSAVRTLAGQTAAVLSDPRRRRAVVRRARAVDRRYHRAVRSGTAVPMSASTAAVRSLGATPSYGPAVGPSRSYRSPGAGPSYAPVPGPSRPYRSRGAGPRRPSGLPPMSVAWVPVPVYRPVRPRGPYGG
ncbi:hypothetical protein OG223_12440 [Streptomyces sp. NBC_01478]|uniref:hypothetical protein n=1 Tax=Streptomyces sp. NBC_01478 TaxID=2903882 RepID=UPI002E30F2C7|nr:hypothetical protein [Streptomyces sp. NBC_01478]